MSDEEENGPIVTGGTATLEFVLGAQYRKITVSDISLTPILRGDGEWLEATGSCGWKHHGYGRTPEAALLSLLRKAMGTDGDEIL